MKLELYGKAVDLRRLALFIVVPLACLVAVAIAFMPASLAQLALMLLLALPIAFLLIDRPMLVFYLLIIILFSNLDVYAPFRLYRYTVILTIASFALALANGRRIVSHHPVLGALLAAFVILAFQSLSVAREYDIALRKLIWLCKVLAVVLITAQFTRDRHELRRFLLVLTGGILLADFLPFIIRPPARFGSLSMIWSEGVVRYEGFVFEPNAFAMFQIFLIPILVFFVVVYRKPAVARLFFVLSILASICVLTLSFSRGGFVGLVSLLVTLVVVERRNRPLLFFGLGLITSGIIAVPGIYWQRVGSLLDFAAKGTNDFAIITRLETMRTAFRLGLANPLLGVGIENFIPRAGYFIPFRLTVHNTLLQIFSEIGIIAFALFIGIIGYNFVIIRRMMARLDDPEAAQLGRALLIQQVAMLATTFFLPGAYEMIVWFMLALPAIAEHAYRREARQGCCGAGVSSGER